MGRKAINDTPEERKARFAAYRKKYYLKNKEKICEKSREYRKKYYKEKKENFTPEELEEFRAAERKRAAAYRKKNPDYYKGYYKENKETLNKKYKVYYDANRETILERHKRNYARKKMRDTQETQEKTLTEINEDYEKYCELLSIKETNLKVPATFALDKEDQDRLDRLVNDLLRS